MIDYVHRLGLA